MADEPVTVTVSNTFNIAPGLKIIAGTITGGTDYDADPGQLCDFSSYVQTIIGGPVFGGVTAAADALVYPTYVNDDFTDADGGAVVYTWDSDSAADAVFENVADTTDMSGYVWNFILLGTAPTRT